jgi:hypothetical protein
VRPPARDAGRPGDRGPGDPLHDGGRGLRRGRLRGGRLLLAYLRLVSVKDHSLLEPSVTSALKILLNECHDEQSRRDDAERKSREDAVAERCGQVGA